LVLYFENRRFTSSEADDLAQEALAELFRREDYEFAKPEDFLKVCYAFARNVSLAAWRKAAKISDDPIDPDLSAPTGEVQGLKDSELSVFLDEVLRLAKENLSKSDWQSIQSAVDAVTGPGLDGAAGTPSTNRKRVKLHRARKLLAKLVGWRKG
jgi:DNA-directed RNA polymerase specialized sigma24 family protein